MKMVQTFKRAVVKERAVIILLLILYVWPWVFPQHTVYAAEVYDVSIKNVTVESVLRELPPPDAVRYVLVTAYSSTPDQTDSTPFVTANGTRVRWGIAAANFLSFNSRVRFPDYFGEETFIITDRMHERFSDRIDIWFPTREEALAFGARWLRVEVWHY